MRIFKIWESFGRIGAMSLRSFIFIGLFIAILASGSSIFAQGGDRYPPNVDPDDVYDISRDLYCDVCQGVPLSDCPSGQCQAWREEIGDLLGDGLTTQEIRQHFARRYGDQVSGVPLDEGNRRFNVSCSIVNFSGYFNRYRLAYVSP